MTELPAIGDNNPPTQFEEHSKAISDLYDEAKLWLDGDPVETEEMAEGISNLMNTIRDAAKKAENARVTEKKPFDDAAKEIQARYKPIIAKANEATNSCKKALEPYLIKKDREARELAEKARREAAEKERLAQEAFKAANPDNLTDRENAHQIAEQAAKAKRTATALSKKPISTQTTIGRAVGLRTRKVAVITDLAAATDHFWDTEYGYVAIKECIQTLANNHMTSKIPGVEIREEKSVA